MSRSGKKSDESVGKGSAGKGLKAGTTGDRAAPTVKSGKSAKWLSIGGTVLGVCLLVAAVWIFGRTLNKYDMAEVVEHLRQIPVHRLVIAVFFVALSYLTQTAYDYLAATSVRLKISPARSTLAAFIGNAFTNNIGFSLLTGTSLRYRFYLAWGYSAWEIAQVVGFSKLAFTNGLFLFIGITQIIDPVRLPETFHLPFSPRIVGALMFLPTAALLFWNGISKGNTLALGRLRLNRPTQAMLCLQIGVSCLHLAFAGCVLYYLLPADALRGAGYHGPLAFLGAYMAIKFVVLFFPVPGGLGVFEGASVAILTPALPDYPVLGALVAFRLAYYVLPFAVALTTLTGYELSSRKGLLASMLRRRRRLAG